MDGVLPRISGRAGAEGRRKRERNSAGTNRVSTLIAAEVNPLFRSTKVKWTVVSVVLAVSALTTAALLRQRTSAVTTAPMAKDDAGRFVTGVMMNGKGPFPFVVDTGAAMSCIRQPLAEKLSLPVVPLVKVQVQGTTGAEKSVLYSARSFSTPVFTRHAEFLVQLPNSSGVSHGVIGMNAFSGKQIILNFATGQLSVRDSGVSAEGWAVLRVQLQGTDVISNVTVDGVPVKAIIDTGARHTVGNTALLHALGLKSEELHAAEPVEGATQDKMPAFAATCKGLSIGPAKIGGPKVVFADLRLFERRGIATVPALLLGIDLLSQLKVLGIDYPRSELQLQP